MARIHTSPIFHKSKQIRKKNSKSSTPGSAKGVHCQATSMERFFAKYSRAVRHPGYLAWSQSHRG